MKILVGLGNPGKDYQFTRHNVGFMFLDYLIQETKLKFKFNKKFQAETVKLNLDNQELVLLKPQTYMNDSGKAVRSLLDFYKISPQKVKANEKLVYKNLYVFHDDLDIIFADFKLQFAKGPKVHNGLNSIYQQLDSDQFWHSRIGIDCRDGDRNIPGKNYVLTKFSKQEKQELEAVFKKIKQRIKLLFKS